MLYCKKSIALFLSHCKSKRGNLKTTGVVHVDSLVTLKIPPGIFRTLIAADFDYMCAPVSRIAPFTRGVLLS